MAINKSKSYVLPLFNDFINVKFLENVNNTYLFLDGKEEELFIIQYDLEGTSEYLEYINILRESQYYKEELIKEPYIYIIFEIPEEIRSDYKEFVSGNFSKIKEKKKIIQFLINNYGTQQFKSIDRIRKVLYKEKSLKYELEYSLGMELPKDSELSSIPSKKSETLII